MQSPPAVAVQRRWLRWPTRSWLWPVALTCGLILFYGFAGYFCTASLIGENPRWRGMNRGPDDFGLKSEVIALRSTDGISLKAWWLPADGHARANIIIAHGTITLAR
jgi:hypothetical protein